MDAQTWILDPDVNGGEHLTVFCDGTDTGWIWHAYGFSHNYGLDIALVIQDGPRDVYLVASRNCGEPVILMYTYFSEAPFFGETNTITLFSVEGVPSIDRLTYWAGGKFPEGFDYQKGPACYGMLWNDGSDKDAYPCDGFLKSVGKRRAWLFNDPQGPEFDLDTRIEKYIHMLYAMGMQPDMP